MNKVILLAPTPPPAGGIAGWTVRMLKATLKNDWTIDLVDEKLIGQREVFNGKKSLWVEIKRCFRIWRELKTKLKDPCVKVVHSCIPSRTTSMMREYVCACITKRSKRKFIVHFRCTIPNTTSGVLGRFMLKLICKKSDGIMVLNTPSKDMVMAVCSTPVFLIPNFVEKSEINATFNVRPEIKKAVYVGGVIPEKGCDYIVKIAKDFPEIQFRMIGKENQSILESSSNVPNVVLTGPKSREEVRSELNDADVFIFLSRFYGEGFSNALAEAMACGLPCLVSDWAANKDMIENKGGCVVPAEDINAMKHALMRMKSPIVRQEFSDFNFMKIKTSYVGEIVVNQYVDCYEKVLSGEV